jgi:hypothetical protein
MTDEELHILLVALERELHAPSVRHDRHRLAELLHPQFLEFGRSGRSYSFAQVIEQLQAGEPTTTAIHAQDFRVLRLARDAALVTYRSAHVGAKCRLARFSLRSSLWRLTAQGWKMAFHQGTPTFAFERSEVHAMPVTPQTLSSLAADYARPMTSIRGRRVQRLVKREFAGAEHVLCAATTAGPAAVLGLSAQGCAVCATDGTGRYASVVKWRHGSRAALETQFDLYKDSLPALATLDVPIAGLRSRFGLQRPSKLVPPAAQALLDQALQVLA